MPHQFKKGVFTGLRKAAEGGKLEHYQDIFKVAEDHLTSGNHPFGNSVLRSRAKMARRCLEGSGSFRFRAELPKHSAARRK